MTATRTVRRSSGGVYDLGLHVVWCPKYRRTVLDGRVAGRLDELIRQKADERGWEIISLEVMPDHVRLFVKSRRRRRTSTPSASHHRHHPGNRRAPGRPGHCRHPRRARRRPWLRRRLPRRHGQERSKSLPREDPPNGKPMAAQLVRAR
nr:IS200/IS605 family transposase [Streptomyces sp. PAN_FS17]